jgi:mercuric ion transport protein
MTRTRLLATGIIGFVVSMLGCVTPALVALLAALGISGSMGWLDYLLLPAMAIFAAITAYAIILRKRRTPEQHATKSDFPVTNG